MADVSQFIAFLFIFHFVDNWTYLQGTLNFKHNNKVGIPNLMLVQSDAITETHVMVVLFIN